MSRTRFDTLHTGSLVRKASSLSIPIASLKLPPITTLSFSTTRSKDWDDIVTGHTDETFARTWSMKDKKMGKHTLSLSSEGKKGPVVGSVKVTFTHLSSVKSVLMICRLSAYLLVVILALPRLPLVRFTCTTCNPASGGNPLSLAAH